MADATKLNYKYIMYAALAVVLILAVWLLFRKRKTTEEQATVLQAASPLTNGYSIGQLISTKPNLGYSGASQGVGETNYNFIMRRASEGWKF